MEHGKSRKHGKCKGKGKGGKVHGKHHWKHHGGWGNDDDDDHHGHGKHGKHGHGKGHGKHWKHWKHHNFSAKDMVCHGALASILAARYGFCDAGYLLRAPPSARGKASSLPRCVHGGSMGPGKHCAGAQVAHALLRAEHKAAKHGALYLQVHAHWQYLQYDCRGTAQRVWSTTVLGSCNVLLHASPRLMSRRTGQR